MTEEPLTETEERRTSLDEGARRLRSLHRLTKRTPLPPSLVRHREDVQVYLEQARERLARPTVDVGRKLDWFLDNDHLVLRSLQSLADDLPPGFLRRLPALGSRRARVDELAREYLSATHLELDPASLESFIRAYQEQGPLRMAELWALPVFLRIVLVESVTRALGDLDPGYALDFSVATVAPHLKADESLARCVRALRMLDETRWRLFFEATSAVEAVLQRDPSGDYARMDTQTRDRYRHTVEDLAWRSGSDEVGVAQRALEWAGREPIGSRESHIGFFLCDEPGPQRRARGRRALEKSYAYSPPRAEKLRRLLTERPRAAWFAGLTLATLVAWAPPVGWVLSLGGSIPMIAFAAAVTFVPATVLSVTLWQWLLTLFLRPRVLPKMDFRDGIPSRAATAVVVPTLIGSFEDVQSLTRQLEVHYLSNPDPNLLFFLLTDFLDASRERLPGDAELVAQVREGVRLLNGKYGSEGIEPFHLIHRDRRFNPGENCWMGWERKRGKLEEFNQLALGEKPRSTMTHEGSAEDLRRIRYVITLDTDTRLPQGAAAKLIGIIDHPLNRPEYQSGSGLSAGYSIVQPRVDILPGSGGRTRFTSVFAGDRSVDPYARAVSDVYQDLFGRGIYVGKGIYDLRAFHATLADRVPENTLLSHDLFEGTHGRVALATDVVLYEDYPDTYLAWSRRMHRWVRGDWQLLPWLGHRPPRASGRRERNDLDVLARWKFFDNLRRSLVSPALFVLLVAGWLVLPGPAWAWTVLALIVPAGQIVTSLCNFLTGRRGVESQAPFLRSVARGLRAQIGRWLAFFVFLPHESRVVMDAIVRTLARFRSHERLLEWRTAAHTARQLAAARGPYALVWTEMFAGPLAGLVLVSAVWFLAPDALACALPFGFLWFASPEIARWLSQPLSEADTPMSAGEVSRLRRIARRTWFFFETFVGPDDQWLPPDNYQEEPGGKVAHRTSPTNIGMMLVSTLSGYDLGYLGQADLAFRLRRAFESLDKLEHYRGHLLNWYDTTTLEPLEPRYVSTVDSGNLAGALLVVQSGCAEAADASILRAELFRGLADVLSLLSEALAIDQTGRLRQSIKEVEQRLSRPVPRPRAARILLRDVRDEWLPQFERRVVEALEAEALEQEQLSLIHSWLAALYRQLDAVVRDVELLLPWLGVLPPPELAAPEAFRDLPVAEPIAALLGCIEQAPSLDALPELAERIQMLVADARELLVEDSPESLDEWLEALENAAGDALANATSLREELYGIGARAEDEVVGMDFRLLYDEVRDLFHIGFHVDEGSLDANHYDLLASEARLASLLAIAKGDAPPRHWFQLGRPVVKLRGGPVLLSWGGTMFEYLMPQLFLPAGRGSFLRHSARAAVQHQIEYGTKRGVPWGVSESGFYEFDHDWNYQYKAFGVPGLGFKRGLAHDLVVTPYASLLALSHAPRAVLRNLDRLKRHGAIGPYGLYEALDFTRTRVPAGLPCSLVRSYMAHHQGMILAAIDNTLTDQAHVRRLTASALLQSVELLLFEEVPLAVTPAALRPWTSAVQQAERRPTVSTAITSWTPVRDAAVPEQLVMAGEHLSSRITVTGAGGLTWRGVALTRDEPDGVRDTHGLFVFVRNEDDGNWFRLGQGHPEQTHVEFDASCAEFAHHGAGILARMTAFVSTDDVELRLVKLTNESERPCRISVTSFAEVVLASPAAARRHPAFERLFVHAALEDGHAQLYTRRPRSDKERSVALVHRLVGDSDRVRVFGAECDRGAFLGRGGSTRKPRAMDRLGVLEGSFGDVLDPCLALRASIELGPGESAGVALVTCAADSPERALEVSRRYLGWETCTAARELAREGAAELVAECGLDPTRLPALTRLFSGLAVSMAAGKSDCPGPRHAERTRLWGHGISGDHPILLCSTKGSADVRIEELVRARSFFARRGFDADLVFQVTSPSSYGEGAYGGLGEILARTTPADVGRRVHFVHSDQMAPEDLAALASSARIVLHENQNVDSIVEQLLTAPHDLPVFRPAGRDAASEGQPGALERPRDLAFDNGLGGFAQDGRVYAIHFEDETRVTPAPWINVLANPRFGCLVSESCFGTTWAVNSGENRLSPWSNDPVSDPPAEVLYLRDEETGEVWSVSPRPAHGGGPYEVRHGAGFSEFRHASHGLLQKTEVFIARDDPVKCVTLVLENLWDHPRRLTGTYYLEWVLGVSRADTAGRVAVGFDETVGAILASCPWSGELGRRVSFLTSREPVHGFTTDRREFLGSGGDYDCPAALRRVGLSGTVARGGDVCAALQVHFDLPPKGRIETHFAIGQGADADAARRLATQYADGDRAEAARSETRSFWDRTLSRIEIRTPEPSMDVLVNRWLLYQVVSARLFGRTAGYQSSGAFGFRDQLQDVLALRFVSPELTREHLLEAARHQFAAGDVLHWWHPPSDAGVRTRCSDDLLWLPFAVAEYVRASGDVSILSEQVPFLTGDPLEPEEHDRYGRFQVAEESGSLFDHCRGALERSTGRGAHGLPLIGSCDWNDGMDRVGARGQGESVWLGWFLTRVAVDFAEICERVAKPDLAERWREAARELSSAVEKEGWDGAWYRRAYNDDGLALGARGSPGDPAASPIAIDSLPQSWAILSGGADPERGQQALESAREHLVRESERIVLLLSPPYEPGGPIDPGYLAAYPPGVRENGGQYTHAATWLALAFARMGDGRSAEELFRFLNPILHARTPDEVRRYAVEPYVLAADVYGRKPYAGRGGWTWYTGAAAWMWRLGTEGILGLRFVDGDLEVDPCLPPDWGGAEAWVRREEAQFHVLIHDPDGVGSGVAARLMDGEPLEGERFPISRLSGSHVFEVVLGIPPSSRTS